MLRQSLATNKKNYLVATWTDDGFVETRFGTFETEATNNASEDYEIQYKLLRNGIHAQSETKYLQEERDYGSAQDIEVTESNLAAAAKFWYCARFLEADWLQRVRTNSWAQTGKPYLPAYFTYSKGEPIALLQIGPIDMPVYWEGECDIIGAHCQVAVRKFKDKLHIQFLGLGPEDLKSTLAEVQDRPAYCVADVEPVDKELAQLVMYLAMHRLDDQQYQVQENEDDEE